MLLTSGVAGCMMPVSNYLYYRDTIQNCQGTGIQKMPLRSKSNQKGFTLVELMITIGVTAIAVALAVPSWENLVQRRQVTSGAEELASFLAYTQGQAIKSNQQVTVTVKRNGTGTAWCVGAIDEETKDANGLDHCECDATTGDAAECLVEGRTARISDGGFEKFAMTGAEVDDSESFDFNFNFDPVRGLKIADDGSVDTDTHEVKLESTNGHWSLQVDISVTGRVQICNPDEDKEVPGFDSCGLSGPIVIPEEPPAITETAS
ncbi:MAG: prepilin-type N-terminal cleavage/methylation domain-containing protein [Xanthomonadales bacterium]|nr:prepilin-type N-terminal cleavage/methylation domain-containing protein [Xanthomonadales bacterium]